MVREQAGDGVKISLERSDVAAYHMRSEHHLERYARGPETLDWDAQPSAFRHYQGAPALALPHAPAWTAELPQLQYPLGFANAAETQRPSAAPVNLVSLGALLGMSLGITAWKTLGPDRWAVRANPSSGNLHPVEAYLVASTEAGIDPGVYHYRADDHHLERRAEWSDASPAGLWIALTCVPWREAWKYGERAFRYCQLDVGHAVAAVRVAAATLGWSLLEVQGVGSERLAALVGIDRRGDFERPLRVDCEREEPEVLLRLQTFEGPSEPPVISALPSAAQLRFWGKASVVDAHPLRGWPVVEAIAAQTREPTRAAIPGPPVALRPPSGIGPVERGRPALALLLGRRSAQRFARDVVQERSSFERILRALCQQASLRASSGVPRSFEFVLWIHRVEGLASGVYHACSAAHPAPLLDELGSHFALERVWGEELQLTRLVAATGSQLAIQARALHCHQEIASSSCFSLGMFYDFSAFDSEPAYEYRRMLRHAGELGHTLYLAAEVEHLRGTAVGCFLDSAVRAFLGLENTELRPVYHFCVGQAVQDARVTTEAAYPGTTTDSTSQ